MFKSLSYGTMAQRFEQQKKAMILKRKTKEEIKYNENIYIFYLAAARAAFLFASAAAVRVKCLFFCAHSFKASSAYKKNAPKPGLACKK